MEETAIAPVVITLPALMASVAVFITATELEDVFTALTKTLPVPETAIVPCCTMTSVIVIVHELPSAPVVLNVSAPQLPNLVEMSKPEVSGWISTSRLPFIQKYLLPLKPWSPIIQYDVPASSELRRNAQLSELLVALFTSPRACTAPAPPALEWKI